MLTLTPEQNCKLEQAKKLIEDIPVLIADPDANVTYKILATYLNVAADYCREVADELAEKAREEERSK
jgi:hypothetical protein